MIQTLIKGNDFGGRYVAMKDFNDHTVVASGQTPLEVRQKASEMGCSDPVITFVPTKDMVQIY